MAFFTNYKKNLVSSQSLNLRQNATWAVLVFLYSFHSRVTIGIPVFSVRLSTPKSWLAISHRKRSACSSRLAPDIMGRSGAIVLDSGAWQAPSSHPSSQSWQPPPLPIPPPPPTSSQSCLGENLNLSYFDYDHFNYSSWWKMYQNLS